MDYIRKIWRGELELWRVYWVWGYLGVGALSLSLIPFNSGAMNAVNPAVIIILFFMAVYMTIINVGIWRSATKYSDKNVTKLWGGFAKLNVIFSVIYFMSVLIEHIYPMA
jgi:hypothetical protein